MAGQLRELGGRAGCGLAGAGGGPTTKFALDEHVTWAELMRLFANATDAGDAALEDLGLEPCPRLSLYPAAAGGSEMLRAGAGSARGLVEELAASLELLRVARWQDKGCR